MIMLKVAAWVAIGSILLIFLSNFVFPRIYEYYWGKFSRKSKLILHKKMEISFYKIYIVRIKNEFIPPAEQLESFIRQTYRDMGLAHAEKDDMEKLQYCHGEQGLATMTVSSEIEPGTVMSIHFMHRSNQHGVEMTDKLPQQGKYTFLAAIDLSSSKHWETAPSNTFEKSAA
jgi:hypothetical protein